MKKILLTLSFITAALNAGEVLSAPGIVLDDVNLLVGQTSADIGIYIQADASAPVDSVAFEYIPIPGFDLTGVTFYKLTDDWLSTVNLSTHKFGATDFGYPSVAIEALNYHFATMHYSFAGTFFDSTSSVQILFNSYELANLAGAVYMSVPISGGLVTAPVPVPAAVWLLGSGLLGLVGLRRKNS